MGTVWVLAGIFASLSVLFAWGMARWWRIQRAYDERDEAARAGR